MSLNDADPSEKLTTVIIYALKDPMDNRMKYVGQTHARWLKMRVSGHISESKRNEKHHTEGTSPKCQWIRSIVAQGFRPILIPLEEIVVLEKHSYYSPVANAAEGKHIRRLLEQGEPILNVCMPGGYVKKRTTTAASEASVA